jgi:hypothetical protein
MYLPEGMYEDVWHNQSTFLAAFIQSTRSVKFIAALSAAFPYEE